MSPKFVSSLAVILVVLLAMICMSAEGLLIYRNYFN